MSVPIESRLHRILRPLRMFKVLGEWSQLQQLVETPSPLDENERLLGIYENHRDSVDQAVVFTDVGMYLREEGGWFGLRYDDVVKAGFGNSGKVETSEITLLLRSGLRKSVPIRGGTGRFRDGCQVLRFLDRSAEDRSGIPLKR